MMCVNPAREFPLSRNTIRPDVFHSRMGDTQLESLDPRGHRLNARQVREALDCGVDRLRTQPSSAARSCSDNTSSAFDRPACTAPTGCAHLFNLDFNHHAAIIASFRISDNPVLFKFGYSRRHPPL